ncbi:pseudouridine synthase [Flammeovirga kamogawensis]|uniref:Pseudouridine synthase n=1 Tax=Flammeovirga kamogawensis TaxID=373891 RepID=A0ABX8GZK9_9BACT|nr:pseudouridine synthase [Flammeovirga kamogawensis]MBB6459274.1 23S rRNA pseudouridine2605 synthase [Flammeovirga kamogawensis]QWG08834.1 rRNA pseudouridine synthase [Flammeovirga kamogawensis]TRX67124.1 rRNA pseudouridine synthase [Flammeovirga kamogawensis]
MKKHTPKKGKNLNPFKKFIKEKPKSDSFSSERSSGPKRSFKRNEEKDKQKKNQKIVSTSYSPHDKTSKKPVYDIKKVISVAKKLKEESDEPVKVKSSDIRLNRYISNSGVCSRREADQLIADGKIKINGKVVTEMGYKVQANDKVEHGGKLLKRERYVYVLLNKPKGFITTTKDPQERKTVMQLVKNACEERIYPVGRLDRNTTGLLLFTNDGEFATKVAHPSSNTQKIYRVELNRPFKEEDEEKLRDPKFELEDGSPYIDGLSVNDDDRREIGIELHSGKNRIVRRIFEHFGYQVDVLDRTVLAGLTKKDLPRGKWRYLGEDEMIQLKYLSGIDKKKKKDKKEKAERREKKEGFKGRKR